MRYSKQRTPIDCGPTVIANACKWAGKPFSYSAFKGFLFKELDLKERGGVYSRTIVDFIKHANVPFKISKVASRVKKKDIELELRKGKAVIMFFADPRSRHVFLITGQTKHYFKGVNFKGRKGKVLDYVPKTFLSSCFFTKALFIKKK